MPYIKQIKIGTTTYDIKDQEVRDYINNLNGISNVQFRGITTTTLSDGAAVNNTTGYSVTSGGTTSTLKDIADGDILIYQDNNTAEGASEYIAAGGY